MWSEHASAFVEVGDGAGELDDFVIGTSGEVELFSRGSENFGGLWVEVNELLYLLCRHLGVGLYIFASFLETSLLDLSSFEHALFNSFCSLPCFVLASQVDMTD
jgi:hypothetical protein